MKELSNLDDELKLLNDKSTWEVPNDNSIGFRIGSTKKGEEFYKNDRYEEIANL